MIKIVPEAKFFLSYNNAVEKFQLPIPPPSIEVTVSNNNTILNINNIGEILMIGKTGLIAVTIDSYFPAQDYSFAQCRAIKKPYEYVKQILNWKDSGNPMRLAITGTKVNHAFAIETFSYKEQDGTGDVYFNLHLKEYKFLNGDKKINEDTGLNDRIDETETNYSDDLKELTIYPSDDAIDIAKRLYGNDYLSQYKNIYKRNFKIGDVLRAKDGNIYL